MRGCEYGSGANADGRTSFGGMKRALKIVLFAVSAILLFALPPLIYEFSS